MVFSSFTFIFLFLPITIILYYIIPKKCRNIRNLVLLIMSLLFYAWGEPIYVFLMILSIVVNYFFGRIIGKYKQAKLWLILDIIFNIGILLFFKYGNFIIININNIFHANIILLKLSLPIGISFYTFQVLSYIIDVYNKNVDVQKNIFSLATYITLFPQLIAGPIVRYITVEDELSNRKETFDNFASGARRFIVGLSKKVIIANNVALLADAVFDGSPASVGSLLVWLGGIAYTLQIYFDFSGYSDMAIGLGKMFGFNFLENFNYPYISRSITDFWRRWHMSLSTWFRDYVYIPLGGNKVSKIKWLRNIFVVWLLTGLWHGASWNFIIWGLYYGILLVVEKLLLKKYLDKMPRIFSYIYTMIFVIIGWIIFRVEDFSSLGMFIVKLFNFSDSNIITFISKNTNVITVWPYLLLGLVASTPIFKKIYNIINDKQNTFINIMCDVIIVIIFIVTIIFLESSSYNPFIYFRF